MTAEAPFAVSTGELPQSEVDAGTDRVPVAGPGSDGATTPGGNGSFPYGANGNGVHSHGPIPGAGSAEDEPAPAEAVAAPPEDRTGSAGPEVAGSDISATAVVAEPGTADAAAEPGTADVTAEPETADAVVADPDPDTVDPGTDTVDTGTRSGTDFATEPDTDSGTDFASGPGAGSGTGLAEPGAGPDGAEPGTAGSLTFEAEPTVAGDPAGETVVVDAVLAEPELVEDAPAGSLADEAVVVEVAEQLGAVVGDDVDPDPAEFAAAAVLDVLRAAGWADAAEASELRAEATRLRELLAEVIRDHRAREASAAGGQNQQLYWLVPLLRAAHGVAFGSLGAKVALRTAVQEVPPDVLASAGLRIDYGVEPAYED